MKPLFMINQIMKDQIKEQNNQFYMENLIKENDLRNIK